MITMENQKLPNVTISLVLGIVSFIACCFSSGFGGVLLSGIALFLANKDKKTAGDNPEDYENFGQLKTARIIAIIGLVLGALMVLAFVGMLIAFGGYSGMQEWQQQQLEQLGA
jgi:hypothetical protein